MRKLRYAVMAALAVAVLWSATIPAQDVPQCCKEQKACCQDGKACCPKKE